jgi:hypothetical protein
MADIEKLTNGKSMGKLGDYEFFMNKNDYKKISHSFTATFGSFKPIKGQEVISDSGGYDRKISLNGVLVLEPLDSLKSLEADFRTRRPLRFTTLTDDIEVLIMSLNIVQEHFIDDGRYTVQTYNLSLEEVYNELQ